jgi:hypothetical protein
VLLQSRIQLYLTYIYDLTDQFGWQHMCYFSLEFTCIWRISMIWPISLGDNTCATSVWNSLVYDVYLWIDRSVWVTTHVLLQSRIQLYMPYIYDLTDQFGWQLMCYFSVEFTCIWRISMIWPISLADNSCATSVWNSLVYDVYLWFDRSVWLTTHVLLQSRIYMAYTYDLSNNTCATSV